MRRRYVGTPGLLFAVALVVGSIGCGDARTSELAANGATTCETCHGQPPDKDLHLVHFQRDTGASGGVPHALIECKNCHLDVQSLKQPDHILRADGSPVTIPAEVRFDDAASLAAKTEEGATRAAAPAYDRTARTCSNVYCHGAGMQGATSGILATPAWDAPAGTVTCGKCHGIPPADHDAGVQITDCVRCHGDAISPAGVPNPDKHVNGTVDFAADVRTSCAGCHGDHSPGVASGDPKSAPPTDAEGRPASDPTATSIGAHQEHLTAADAFGVKVACSECHAVPATLLSPGHFDNQVTVTFGPLASKGAGTAPSYNRTTQTCSNVYCHGDFPGSKTTPPPSPTWNQGAAAIACGTCHDLPPPAPTHVVVDVATQGCGTSTNPLISCHPAPYSPTTVDPALHIDGRICPPFCTPAP